MLWTENIFYSYRRCWFSLPETWVDILKSRWEYCVAAIQLYKRKRSSKWKLGEFSLIGRLQQASADSDESEEADTTAEVAGESWGSTFCALSHLTCITSRSVSRAWGLRSVSAYETEPQHSGVQALISLYVQVQFWDQVSDLSFGLILTNLSVVLKISCVWFVIVLP